jgi:hypothetical protein
MTSLSFQEEQAGGSEKRTPFFMRLEDGEGFSVCLLSNEVIMERVETPIVRDPR